MVEFALILFPLLILVVGIIQFGIGLNYWLDMNRLANQGARWAVVNAYRAARDGAPTTPTPLRAEHRSRFSGTSRASGSPELSSRP